MKATSTENIDDVSLSKLSLGGPSVSSRQRGGVVDVTVEALSFRVVLPEPRANQIEITTLPERGKPATSRTRWESRRARQTKIPTSSERPQTYRYPPQGAVTQSYRAVHHQPPSTPRQHTLKVRTLIKVYPIKLSPQIRQLFSLQLWKRSKGQSHLPRNTSSSLQLRWNAKPMLFVQPVSEMEPLSVFISTVK